MADRVVRDGVGAVIELDDCAGQRQRAYPLVGDPIAERLDEAACARRYRTCRARP